MKRLLAFLLTYLATTNAAAQQLDSLRAAITARIAQTPSKVVGVYFHDLGSGDTLLVNANVRFHAASTMKVPVMIQLYRDRDAGKLTLDDSVPITNTFTSIFDGSPYQLDKADDSDSTLYGIVGQKRTIRQLVELMETVSSNLATNLLIALVDAKRANATAHSLGADSILVLRGVEHKTGWIGGVVYHDAGIVRPTRGAPYVLVVLTGGVKDDSVAYALVRDISHQVYSAVRSK